VFYGESRTLAVHAPRAAEREMLRRLFAEVVIGDRDYFEDGQTPKFCFEPLRDPGFAFPTRGIDNIEQVAIVRLVARPAHRDVPRVTVDIKPSAKGDIRPVLEKHGVDLAVDEIHAIRLQFRFDATGRARYRTVSLTQPNYSNLTDTERDRVIRRYLMEWGIDARGARTLDSAGVEDAP